MTKYRLYGEDMKPHGTIKISNDFCGDLSIQSYSKNVTNLTLEFRKVVKKFLEDNKLKIISSEACHRKHCNHKPYITKIKDFNIYSTYYNSKTHKTELRKIEKEVNDKNGKK